jgi:hypothetical protein
MGVLFYPLDVKGLAVAADRNDQLVVLDIKLLALDLRAIRGGTDVSALVCLDANRLVFEVNVGRPCLVELVQAEAADGLNGRAEL